MEGHYHGNARSGVPAPPPRGRRRHGAGTGTSGTSVVGLAERMPMAEYGSSPSGLQSQHQHQQPGLFQRPEQQRDAIGVNEAGGRNAPTVNGNILTQTPETTIGKAVRMKGELVFERLLRIDGQFDGTLVSKGNLIVGTTGVLNGDVSDMAEMVVDGGKVIGNISVDRLTLLSKAAIHGDITCKSLAMEPAVSLIGKLNVNPFAPDGMDVNGERVLQQTKPPSTTAQEPAVNHTGGDPPSKVVVPSAGDELAEQQAPLAATSGQDPAKVGVPEGGKAPNPQPSEGGSSPAAPTPSAQAGGAAPGVGEEGTAAAGGASSQGSEKEGAASGAEGGGDAAASGAVPPGAQQNDAGGATAAGPGVEAPAGEAASSAEQQQPAGQ